MPTHSSDLVVATARRQQRNINDNKTTIIIQRRTVGIALTSGTVLSFCGEFGGVGFGGLALEGQEGEVTVIYP